MVKRDLTYISLFSSAGVGCYGFKMADFKCVATNEFLEKRLAIQKLNAKCELESGYIAGDIKLKESKDKIFNELAKWQLTEKDQLDVLIATPPCQGMSVANHKKASNEIDRNSLIVESVILTKQIHPKVFVYENVAAFWKTGCVAPNGEVISIGQMIEQELGADYKIHQQVMNFKNYGANSSRTRTLVLGISKSCNLKITPESLMPDYVNEPLLRQVIGHLPSLEWGEYASDDFYHSFRTYSEQMRAWIKDLPPGASAFDNEDPCLKPHRIIDGKLIINQAKNGDKYKRQVMDKVAPCIHTRNDILSSQNTIHPYDDRVFSIRELMLLMTIPHEFKWVAPSLEELNSFSLAQKQAFSKKHEMTIRCSIGESVPTAIFYQIATKISANLRQENLKQIKKADKQNTNQTCKQNINHADEQDTKQTDKLQSHNPLTLKEVKELIQQFNLTDKDNLKDFLRNNESYSYADLACIIEYTNQLRLEHSAYYTDPILCREVEKVLPDFGAEQEITILEPSVGAGNFLPFLFAKYSHLSKVHLILIDIDPNILEFLEIILLKHLPANFTYELICSDFMFWQPKPEQKIDLTIGNPPFAKVSGTYRKDLALLTGNNLATNLAAFFIEKATVISTYTGLVLPKNILNTPEYSKTRKQLLKHYLTNIIDFGELGFKGVLIETIYLQLKRVSCNKLAETNNRKTLVVSLPKKITLLQDTSYITDPHLPYWVIYRDHLFDQVLGKMELGVFTVFRDRQITNSLMTENPLSAKAIRVVKARNLTSDGKIINIDNYDRYIEPTIAEDLTIYKYLNDTSIFLTPNMTYNPRLVQKQGSYIVNGSVAILIPIRPLSINQQQLAYISSDEYRRFYQIARNFQTRSLNIDSSSCYWFGINKELSNGEI